MDITFYTFDAKSLQAICIDFLVGNLDIVQSLHTLPVTVAKELFLLADIHDQFSIPSATVFKRLELFSSTFTKYFVTSLSLRHSSHLINYLSREFTVFSGVSCLDLSHCKLGDKHSILSQLNYFTKLTLLALRDNGLSRRGIDYMTTSLRLLKQGPNKLQYLDISENRNLDSSCLEYLKVFSQLVYLDLSNTAISITDAALKNFPLKVSVSRSSPIITTTNTITTINTTTTATTSHNPTTATTSNNNNTTTATTSNNNNTTTTATTSNNNNNTTTATTSNNNNTTTTNNNNTTTSTTENNYSPPASPMDYSMFTDVKECTITPDLFHVETVGWASHVFNSWSTWYKNKTKRSPRRHYTPYTKKKMKDKSRRNFQLILMK